MALSFFKYHGTGNDFILIDNRENQFNPGEKLIAWLCHRRFGIGADGFILLNKADGYDFGMTYFNSDGRESTMCGNGGRCIIAFADFLSLSGNNYRFLGVDGEHTGTVLQRKGNRCLVRLSMKDVEGYEYNNRDFIIDTGSPHLVRFMEDVNRVDVVNTGRIIRNQAEFQPGGINVNFVQQYQDSIFVRTYERGVEDETLSCGTGVTASALALSALKNIDKGIIHVATRGGLLDVYFSKKENGFRDILLEGPAIQIYAGKIDLNDLNISPVDQL